MSDAIMLDVADATPVRLDVGDVDPIAREEIAALAGRVTTVEGDVTALDGRMDTAEGEISTLGTTVDGIDARVEAIEADYVTAEDVMGVLGGEAPSLSAGSATGITGDVETASWMARQTNADGAALIESVKGNTLRWNQLVNNNNTGTTATGVTFTNNGNGSWTVDGTASDEVYRYVDNPQLQNLIVGHKYLAKGCPAGGSASTYMYRDAWWYAFIDYGDGVIFTVEDGKTACTPSIVVKNGATVNNLVFHPQLFDLTQMFGAGNEPATVDEFESLFPEPYYPYDAGSLLPVRIEGVETVGFNQWDEQWELGYIGSNGANASSNSCIRSKNHIPVFPSTEYYVTVPRNLWTRCMFYDADKAFISGVDLNSTRTLTTPDNAAFMRFYLSDNYGTTYNHDICINISDTARNGTYEPHWRSERAIAASTYFPDGMRSAGTVSDELRADAAVTRVGSVDLGTLTWAASTDSVGQYFLATLVGILRPTGTSAMPSAICEKYVPAPSNNVVDKSFGFSTSSDRIFVRDTAYTDAAAFKAAMSGVMLHYSLATPTTTPIDPPLPMSYRVGRGGTERVMVAEGTTSAPPIFATRYPLDPADLAASIAPVDGPTAKSNHQVGDLIMLGFTLCKATQVIVTGETIAIGTNVTRTTVAAELAALSE